MIKQEDPELMQQSKELLEQLKELRGGSVLDTHRQLANDPKLLLSFIEQYKISHDPENKIPAKYRELMTMAIGAAMGVETTVKVHANLAVKYGASVEEIGETFRIVYMLAGVKGLFQASNVFDILETE